MNVMRAKTPASESGRYKSKKKKDGGIKPAGYMKPAATT